METGNSNAPFGLAPADGEVVREERAATPSAAVSQNTMPPEAKTVVIDKQATVAPKLAAEATKGVATESRASSAERWRIIIDEPRDQTDAPEAFVGVNGRAYQIKRGVAVDVPPEVVHVLNNAVAERSFPKVNEVTGMPEGIVTRKYRRFPFQMLGKSRDAAGNWLMDKDAGKEVNGKFN